MGFLHTIIVAVDAGVQGSEGNGDSHERKIGCALGFHQNETCQNVCMAADGTAKDKRQAHGENQSGSKDAAPPGGTGGNLLGQGGLDGTRAQGKADAKDRVNHIVETQTFRADGAG